MQSVEFAHLAEKRSSQVLGMMFVRRDGSILWFKSSKARKNFVKLGRNARRVKWTRHFVKGGIQ